MGNFLHLPLAEAEYYVLWDWRSENQFLYDRRAFDPDPAASAAIAEKILRLRRLADPGWAPSEKSWEYVSYFDGDAEIAPELVSKKSGFKIRQPAPMPHIDATYNWAEMDGGVHHIVSAAWRRAIESLEPGVHQFFPHELRFRDAVVSDYFILRTRGPKLERPDFQIGEVEDAFSDIVGYRFQSRDREPVKPPMLDREKVQGRHWIATDTGWMAFVSRALAEKLHPLLPEYVCLLPVEVSGAAPRPKVSPWVAADGARTFGRRARPPRVEPTFADPRLAEAFEALSKPDLMINAMKRQEILETASTILKRMPAAWAFETMKETLKFDGPLEGNPAFGLCAELSGLRPERDVLPAMRAWAQDPDPLVRYALVRVLWFRFFSGIGSLQMNYDTEPPGEASRVLFLALTRDADPRVQAFAIGCMLGVCDASFDAELRPRLPEIAGHPDSRVRCWAKELAGRDEDAVEDEYPDDDTEEAAETALRGGAEAVLELALEKEDGQDTALNALSSLPRQEVAASALYWARDKDAKRRKLAARALETATRGEPPCPPEASEALQILLADAEPEIVTLALRSFNGCDLGFSSLAPLVLHSDDAVREEVADTLVYSELDGTLTLLVRLADDKAVGVRRKAAMALQNRAVLHGDAAVREPLAALLGDECGWTRGSAIDGLSALGDKRAIVAIQAELEIEPPTREEMDAARENHDAEEIKRIGDRVHSLGRLPFLMATIGGHPDARYVKGLMRLQQRFPSDPGIAMALRACEQARSASWF